MLINEACTLTGLTKKEISYYEKQNLIRPKKGDNGYREYSEEDISVLNEISLYRKLDISIKDIKVIVKSKDKKDNGEFIKKELIRAFPSGIGRYLAYHLHHI